VRRETAPSASPSVISSSQSSAWERATISRKGGVPASRMVWISVLDASGALLVEMLASDGEEEGRTRGTCENGVERERDEMVPPPK
jgi:hypothetical protein